MKVQLQNIFFGYNNNPLFSDFSLDIESSDGNLIILGPSGSGKTTLLKLLSGILKPKDGKILYTGFNNDGESIVPKTSFMFQEPRLLPWLTVLQNVQIPLEKQFGKSEAVKRTKHFLSLVSMEDKEGSYPAELSGGQSQRVSMARAFAWPSPMIFMDEPFQALDIGLKINLMDLTNDLVNSDDKRLLVFVSHDPREAVYLGNRIVILGRPGTGIIYDNIIDIPLSERTYGSPSLMKIEMEITEALRNI